MLSRHTRKRSNSGIDLRAGTLPLELPPPGDPTRSRLSVADLTWTLKLDHEWLVQVAPLRNKQPTFGFLLQEAARQAGGPLWGGLPGAYAQCVEWFLSLQLQEQGGSPAPRLVAQNAFRLWCGTRAHTLLP